MPATTAKRKRRRAPRNGEHWKVTVWKTISETVKYLADATFKFLFYAFPILYMQWSNGDRLVDQGKKLDDVAVKADAAVEKAETAAVKAEESVKVIREKMDP